MQLIGKTKIDFIGMRNISFIISGIISLIGIIAVVQIARGAANMGIDFSGGTALQIRFAKPFTTDEVRKVLADNGMKEVDLQEIKDGNQLLIKMRKSAAPVGKIAETVEQVFRKALPGNSITIESTTEIGPSIGDKLRKDTLIAVVISLICIVIYIAWRFDFKFGIGAVVATLHDVLAILAVFFVMNKEINLLLITAVLTIAGYSLTDTVVVFDRIRENLKKNVKDSLHNVFNFSINEVLSRTIVTSLTTFLAASSLWLLGGEVIHDFAFALVVGIVVATYSSVFVASPVVAILEDRGRSKA